MKKPKLTCEMCRKNSALKQTETGNLLCDPCYLLFIDAHNHAATTRGLGWPLYNSSIHNLFGTFILIGSLFFISPTPNLISPTIPIIDEQLFSTTTPHSYNYINLDDPEGNLHQVYCSGNPPLCVEWEW